MSDYPSFSKIDHRMGYEAIIEPQALPVDLLSDCPILGRRLVVKHPPSSSSPGVFRLSG